MSRKKLAYWITDRISDHHREKIPFLAKLGYEITFFSKFNALMTTFTEQRVATIIVGDEGPFEHVQKLIQKMAILPELAGVRLILSFSGNHPELTRTAYQSGFRDIIPIDLDNKSWAQRLLFSSAGSAANILSPVPQVLLNNVSSINLPARITWMSSKRICIETKASPPKDTVLKLKGPVAENLGVKGITLIVEENRSTNLKYRYSEAIVCRWTVPQNLLDRQVSLMNHLKNIEEGPICKVFIAVKSPALRTTLITQLNGPTFELSTALHKQSMVQEPKFFSPNIVFIEDTLCASDDYSAFAEMAEGLSPEIPIIIIGRNLDAISVKRAAHGKRVTFIHQVPKNLDFLITKRFLNNSQYRESRDPDAFMIAATSEFSTAEINFAASLTRLHPLYSQLSLPYKIGNFALCRVDSPFIKDTLGRSVYLKVTKTWSESKTPKLPFTIEGYFADLMLGDRDKVGRHLVDLITERFISDPAQRLLVKKNVRSVIPIDHAPPSDIVPTILPLENVANDNVAPSVQISTETKTVPFKKRAPEKQKINYRLSGREVGFLILILILFGMAGIGVVLMSDSSLTAGKVFSDSVTKFRDLQNTNK